MDDDSIGPLGQIDVEGPYVGLFPGIDIDPVAKKSRQSLVTDKALSSASNYHPK
nr:hypothetical protein [Corynebacterium timonense]